MGVVTHGSWCQRAVTASANEPPVVGHSDPMNTCNTGTHSQSSKSPRQTNRARAQRDQHGAATCRFLIGTTSRVGYTPSSAPWVACPTAPIARLHPNISSCRHYSMPGMPESTTIQPSTIRRASAARATCNEHSYSRRNVQPDHLPATVQNLGFYLCYTLSLLAAACRAILRARRPFGAPLY